MITKPNPIYNHSKIVTIDTLNTLLYEDKERPKNKMNKSYKSFKKTNLKMGWDKTVIMRTSQEHRPMHISTN
jgi:hypothetical protein